MIAAIAGVPYDEGMEEQRNQQHDPREDAQQRIIAALHSVGYYESGWTARYPIERFVIRLSDGQIDGDGRLLRRESSPRRRFKKDGQPVRATVGPQTTNFYTIGPEHRGDGAPVIRILAGYKTLSQINDICSYIYEHLSS